MLKLVEMEEKVTISEQMKENIKGTVILIAKFNVKSEEVDDFLKAWADDAAYLKQQTGFISTQSHRGIGGSSVFVKAFILKITICF